MREWTRAKRDRICGHCRAEVPRGEPLFVMRIAGRELVRCPAHAGEPVPAFLPPLPDVTTASARSPASQSISPAATTSAEWMPFRDGGEA